MPSHDGSSIRVLFSGDTIVDREHWGDRALGEAWGNQQTPTATKSLIDRLTLQLYGTAYDAVQGIVLLDRRRRKPRFAQLQKMLPHVEIQPKGVLATEAFVSIPLLDQPHSA